MDKHPFQGPDNGSCTYRQGGPGGKPCAYLAANEIHQNAAGKVNRPNPSGPTAPGRRRVPWNELPPLTQAMLIVLGMGSCALFLSLVVAACTIILRAAGVIG